MKRLVPLLLILSLLPLACCNASHNSEKSAQNLLELCNEQRTASGILELSINETLNKNAQVRADEIAQSGEFSHIRPDGKGCFTILTVKFSYAGENLSMGDGKVEDVFNEWMNSNEHKENIMNDSYTQTGFGYAEKDGTVYWAQLFTG